MNDIRKYIEIIENGMSGSETPNHTSNSGEMTKFVSLIESAMRVIPLGKNVQYFYHPDIEDFTAWIYSDIKPAIMDAIEDFIDRYDVDSSHS